MLQINFNSVSYASILQTFILKMKNIKKCFKEFINTRVFRILHAYTLRKDILSNLDNEDFLNIIPTKSISL
jgi:hypothetical protein